MSSTHKAARDGGLGTVVAGRGGESAKGGVPTQRYHKQRGGARPELVRVWTPQGRRTVGAFVRYGETVAFVKKGNASAHKLRRPEGWAVDAGALEEVGRRGVERIVVRDEERGVYWARFADFEEHGVPIDRGFGAQVVLGVQWWSFAPHGSVTASQPVLFPGRSR